eukprot:TRINITY_DN8137_c0_g2_i1.p1 TRINITY_DN8137_c0_g2~~TRINITY_DN8137_c0_g2_i1.p1  ORF type:complete len:324 (-),score=82.55 TRINITY_DN8137_c0_g2_i1:315-1286(-)
MSDGKQQGSQLEQALAKFKQNALTMSNKGKKADEGKGDKDKKQAANKKKPAAKDKQAADSKEPAKKKGGGRKRKAGEEEENAGGDADAKKGGGANAKAAAKPKATPAKKKTVPIPKVKKDVLDLLKKNIDGLTLEEIDEKLNFDIQGDEALQQALMETGRIEIMDGVYKFKAKYQISDKFGLLELLKNFQNEGLPADDLKDSYKNVMNDIEELKKSRDLYGIWSTDIKGYMLYPQDPALKIDVDDDLVEFYRGIEHPLVQEDFDQLLQEYGITPTRRTAKRQRAAPIQSKNQKKKTKERKIRRYTNTHLMELFKDPAPDNLDG